MIIPFLPIIPNFSLCHVNTSFHGLSISTLKARGCSTPPIPIFYIQSKYIFKLLFELQIARMTYTQSISLMTNIYLSIHTSLHQYI